MLFPNDTKQIVKRAGLNRYYGVTFENGTKQTPGMRDAVTFQDGLDLEITNWQPLILIPIALNKAQAAQQPK